MRFRLGVQMPRVFSRSTSAVVGVQFGLRSFEAWRRSTWMLLLAVLSPGVARGQSNFDFAQLGGRTAMMGGAAVATGADEATAFMNPAGITRIPGQSFSFTTFAVNLSNRTIVRPLDPSGNLNIDKPNLTLRSLRFVPNTFCLFLDGPPKDRFSGRSRHKYALCAAGTERERMSFTRSARATSQTDFLTGIGHSTDMTFLRSSVALSWGFSLTRYTSIGVTFRTDNTRFQDSTTATAFGSTTQSLQLQSMELARDAWSWDTSVLVGMTTSLSQAVTLGAALATPSQHLFGSYQGVSTVSTTEGNAFGTTQDHGDFRYNLPGSLRLGLAFSWPRVSFEIDASFYGPQAQRARANFDRSAALRPEDDGEPLLLDERTSVTARGAAVTNLAFGMEYFLVQNFSILSGVNTDFSGLTKMHDQLARDVLFRQRKDSIHGSLGVSSYGERGSILIGLRGTYSWGEAMIADPTVVQPVFRALPQSEWGVSLVLSGRINFRTVREVAERATTPLGRSRKESESKANSSGKEQP